jgi:lysine-specific demethylase 3
MPGSSDVLAATSGSSDGVCLKDWYKGLPPEDYRMASQRPDGVQNYIWTPHVRDFALTSPRRAETLKRFVERWAAGEPIIIRGFRGRMNWGPSLVMRAARDILAGETSDHSLINCSDWTKDCTLSAQAFCRAYAACHGPSVDANGVLLPMLKLKDFPPDETFAARCSRHNDDFLEMLCNAMPEYMHPTKGILNLAAALPETAVPPDLGPKGYIAFGREEEALGEGDSVTRLHKDLSDAINILCHVQHPPETAAPPPARCGDAPLGLPGCGGAGALWDLIRREDLPIVRRFLEDVISGKETECPPFV